MEKLEPTLDKRCGTYAGYKAHRKRNEQLCTPCREAMRAYRRENYNPDVNRKHAKKYKEANKELVKQRQKRYNLDPEVKAARKTEKAKLAADRAALQKEEKKSLRAAKIEEERKATLARQEARRIANEERKAATQAKLAAKYAAMNAAREERKAKEKAEKLAVRKLKSEAVRQQKKLEKKANRIKKETNQVLLANQHGTTVGDYDRCRKNNKTACDLCREVAAKYVREKYKSDPKYKESEKLWRRANPNKVYRSNKDRAVKRGAKHAYYTREHIFQRDGYDCYLCNTPVDLQANHVQGQPNWELYPHIEHVIPLSKGGDDTLENVKIAHAICNINKGIRLLPELASP